MCIDLDLFTIPGDDEDSDDLSFDENSGEFSDDLDSKLPANDEPENESTSDETAIGNDDDWKRQISVQGWTLFSEIDVVLVADMAVESRAWSTW